MSIIIHISGNVEYTGMVNEAVKSVNFRQFDVSSLASLLRRFQKDCQPKFNHTPQTYTSVGSGELIRQV